MENSQGNSTEDSQGNVEKNPKKNSKSEKTQINVPRAPRKRKCSKVETKGSKALAFFDEVGMREADGVSKQLFMCQLCGKELIGSNPSNLASHLHHKHSQIYADNIANVDETVQIKRLKLLQNCVSIVALGGRPCACLMDFGFQQIVAKQLSEFQLAGHPLHLKQIDQPDVHEYLHHAADLVRGEVKDAIKNRPISVQIDLASRLGRTFFAIDVQYVEKSNVIIHNIGMVILDKSHTSENILESYRNCLKRYDIGRKQVVSITGDNGKDVQKMIRLEQTNATTEPPPPKKRAAKRLNFEASDLYEKRNEQSEKEAEINEEIMAILESDEPTDDDAIDMIFGECDINLDDSFGESQPTDSVLNETLNTIATEHDNNDTFNLSGIRCAPHTLQLVVKNSIAALPEETKNVIKLCRRITKILRLESTKHLIEESGIELKKPRLDAEPRWGSTYVMVNSFKNVLLLILKVFVALI